MKLARLKALIIGLTPPELSDLYKFLKYRNLEDRLPGKLLHILSQENGDSDKDVICSLLKITDGSFRTAKSELSSNLLRWRAVNARGWHAQLLRKLTDVYNLLDLGEYKKAYALATELQQKAEKDGQFPIAIMVCELRTSLLPMTGSNLTEHVFSNLQEELKRLKHMQREIKKTEVLLAQVTTLQCTTFFLRNEVHLQHAQTLQRQLTHLPPLFHTAIPHIHTQLIHSWAGLLQMQGAIDNAYMLMLQHWKEIDRATLPLPLADHRYHPYFFRLIEFAIHCHDWETAMEINLLHQAAIDRYHGNLPQANALNLFLNHLINLDRHGATKQEMAELYQTVQLTMKAHQCHNLHLDLQQWDTHICASILALAIVSCFDHGMYKECDRLLGLVKQLNPTASGMALDLQIISPLIQLAVLVQHHQNSLMDITTDRFFESRTNYAYDYFRKTKNTAPIEWHLARLFNGISAGKKDLRLLFSDMEIQLEQLKTECTYYNAFMQLFNFEKWIAQCSLRKPSPSIR